MKPLHPAHHRTLAAFALSLLTLSAAVTATFAADRPGDAPADPTPEAAEPGPGAGPTWDSAQAFGDLVLVGNSLVVREGETAHSVVVMGGDATMNGTVRRDLVVMGGDVEVNGTVTGNLVVILGQVRLGPHAVIRRDLTVLGGTFKADPSAVLGRKRCVIGVDEDALGNSVWMKWGSQWLKSGFFRARPLPHQYAWGWATAGMIFLLYFLLSVLFPRQVQATLVPLETKPGSSLLAGLLALMLAGPLFLLLAITVVGLALVPFLAAGLFAAGVLGRVAVCHYVGRQITTQLSPNAPGRPLVELTIGAMLLCLIYLVPVAGLLTWLAVAPLGLGAVVLSLFKRNPAAGVAAVPPAGSGFAPPIGAAGSEGFVDLPPVRVGFWLRLAATALDLLLIGLISTAALHRPRWFLFLWVIYHLLFWTWRGTTIGGIIVGLKIVRTDGRPVNFMAALVRLLAAFLSAAALGLGFCWAGWGEEKRSWHDTLADTLVIRCRRSSLLG